MKSKALLFSNLYATVFVATLVHWAISLFIFGIDIFQVAYNFIYTGCLKLPIVAFPTSEVLFKPLSDWSGLFLFGYYPWEEYVYHIDHNTIYILITVIALFVCTVAAILGWIGFAKGRSGYALAAAILFLLVSMFLPVASLFTIPLVAFSFLGFGMQKACE